MNIRKRIIIEAIQSMKKEEEDWGPYEPLPTDPEEARKRIKDEEDSDWEEYDREHDYRFPEGPDRNGSFGYADGSKTYRESQFKKAMGEAPDDWVDEDEDGVHGVWDWSSIRGKHEPYVPSEKLDRDYSWRKWLERRTRSAKDSMDPEFHRWNQDERDAWAIHREAPRSGNPKNWEHRIGSRYDYRPAYSPKYEIRKNGVRGWPDAAKIADYWEEADEWRNRQKEQK